MMSIMSVITAITVFFFVLTIATCLLCILKVICQKLKGEERILGFDRETKVLTCTKRKVSKYLLEDKLFLACISLVASVMVGVITFLPNELLKKFFQIDIFSHNVVAICFYLMFIVFQCIIIKWVLKWTKNGQEEPFVVTIKKEIKDKM